MEPVRLWAAVRFSTKNGGTEAFLSAAAQAGLHLSGISALPGGVRAQCAARHYIPLARLARRHRVHMRVEKRQGLYFAVRALLRRTGLWAGICVFVPLLMWAQTLVWAVDYTTLTAGQRTRAAAILRESAAIAPGSVVTEAKLAAGEYALLQSGEFSWASLNFLSGRLTVEAAAAKAVPEIASGTLHGIRAKTAGTVISTNLVSGTMLVEAGQQVEEGQGLIGTARAERDGTLIFEPAAGTVRAQFVWQGEFAAPLSTAAKVLTGRAASDYDVSFAGRTFLLPFAAARGFGGSETAIERHWQPELFGLPLPFAVKETTYYEQIEREVAATENGALAQARLKSLRQLYAAYPDAEIKSRKEAARVSGGEVHFTVAYTITADICE